MADSLPLQCDCGAVQGAVSNVSSRVGNRLICYCDDCQAFARFLDESGGTLDANGGTEIFQLSPARVSFHAGKDRLACIRLSERGPLRWYADCCRTPIGNTLASGKIPFVGLIHSAMRPEPRTLDDWLGPVRAKVMVKFALGGLERGPNVHDGFDGATVVWFFSRMIRWRLQGDHRRSPFFQGAALDPIAVPRMIRSLP